MYIIRLLQNVKQNKNNLLKVSLICFLFTSNILFSQQGLEKIIVEKYYISTAEDTNANNIAGKLPIGSTTYRIYVDLLPGYKFLAAYGSPEHELFIKSSTQFFNNEDHGAIIANVIPFRTLKKNTVMLDSWLSVGAAGEDCFGILKEQDDSLETVKHEKKFLQNTSRKIGFPLTIRDGLLKSDKVPRPFFFHIDSAANAFNSIYKTGFFQVKNGAWACLGGTKGCDSLTTNRVLIAQITTDGELSFELNIQIATPIKGVSQRFVARNPIEDEICIPSLVYTSGK
jgi:hypothetical protein